MPSLHLTIFVVRATIGNSRGCRSTELQDTIVARFEPGFSAAAGDGVALAIKREDIQLFDPGTGESLRAA